MRQVLIPLLWLAAFAAAAPASAKTERTEVRSQREDAGARVRQVERAGGRVLQAEPMQRGGEEVYRLKVLTPEGRVRVISGEGQARESGDDRRRESADLTARRRDFRNDQGTDVARDRRERQQREDQRRERPQRGDDGGGNRDVD